MGNDLVNFCVEPTKYKEQNNYERPNDNLPKNVIKPKIKKLTNKPNQLLYSSIISLYNVKSPFAEYEIIEYLSTGEHGKVYKVKNKLSNDIKIMKMISESQILNENSLKEEITLMKSLNKNENIINIYKVIYNYENNLYFIYDYYPLGNLLNYVISNNFFLDESLVKILMFKLFNAISFLHTNKIIHGNLKLENILLYDENNNNKYIGYSKKNERYNDEDKDEICNIMPHRNLMLTSSVNLTSKYSLNYFENLDSIKIKLVDFGLNKLFKNANNNEFSEINHLLYRSPESLNGEYNMKSDIWSCGIIMYTLLSGENPFINNVYINKISKETITQDNLIQKIKSAKYSFNKKVFKSISYDAKDLIRKCLLYNQNERINIKDALNHKFFINDIRNSIITMSSVELVNKENSNKIDKTQSNSNNNDLDLDNEISTSNLNQSYKLSNKLNGKIMEDLIYFCKQSPLFKFTINYIIHNCQLKIDLNDIKKLYMEIVGNLEDKISKEEFYNYLSDINYQFKEIVILNFFDNVDYDKDGYIDLNEFSLLAIPIEEVINKDNLKEVFSLFEVNSNGFFYLSDVLYSDQIFNDNDFENKTELCNIFENKDVIYFDEFCNVIFKYLDKIE